jgi:hypothetical protein
MMERSEIVPMKWGYWAHLVLAGALVLTLSPMAWGQKYVFNALSMPTGQNPADVGTGDFNGDGIADLVVTNQGESTVSTYLGKADGTFQATSDVPGGANPRYVGGGARNGDGSADLVNRRHPNATVTYPEQWRWNVYADGRSRPGGPPGSGRRRE